MLQHLPSEGKFFAMMQPMNVHGPYHTDPAHAGTYVDPAQVPFDALTPNLSMSQQGDQISAAYKVDPEKTRDAVIGMYDEEILAIDDALVVLRAGLEARGLWENTVIVFAADHGETLDDDGNGTFGHGYALPSETLRVPWMILNAGLPADTHQSDCLAEAQDMSQTLLRAMGLPDVAGLDARPLQDGCRVAARSSLYEPSTGELRQISVTDGSSQILVSCTDGGRISNELPWGFPPLDSSDELDVELNRLAGSIRESLGDQGICVGF